MFLAEFLKLSPEVSILRFSCMDIPDEWTGPLGVKQMTGAIGDIGIRGVEGYATRIPQLLQTVHRAEKFHSEFGLGQDTTSDELRMVPEAQHTRPAAGGAPVLPYTPAGKQVNIFQIAFT
jgi:hypothetical protein